jgi:hypothetical protein
VPVPETIEAVPGVTAMLVRVGAETVRFAVPVMPPEVALIVAVPAANAVAIPVLVIAAIAGLELDQFEVDVQVALDPSEYTQVATYCCVPAIETVTEDGATLTLVTVGPPAPMVMLPVPALVNVSTPAVSVTADDGAPSPEIG